MSKSFVGERAKVRMFGHSFPVVVRGWLHTENEELIAVSAVDEEGPSFAFVPVEDVMIVGAEA